MVSENVLSMLEESMHNGISEAEEDEVIAPLVDMADAIEDEGIRSFVRACLFCAPDVFWSASSALVQGSEHPPDEMVYGGNVLHTRRVFRFAGQIATAQHLPQEEVDLLLAAALLHDIAKFVETPDGEIQFQRFYPYLFDEFVLGVINFDKDNEGLRHSTSLEIDPDDFVSISRLIRTHQGMNSMIPETQPSNNLEWAIHLADLLAVTVHHIIDDEPKAERWH